MEKENRVLHKRIDRLEPLAEENKDLRQANSELKDKTSVLEAKNADLKAEVASLSEKEEGETGRPAGSQRQDPATG